MLSFMSDRRVLAVSAAFITAAIFLFLLGTYPSWRAAIGDGLSWRERTPTESTVPPAAIAKTPSSSQSSTSAPAKPEAVGQASAPAARSVASDAPAPNLGPAAQPAAQAPPSFDVVRVEPNGDSVIAARGKAGETVVLLDQGRPIARAQADASGQVAFVPPPLAPGDHSLMLSLGEPNTPGALSSQSVAVSVPERAKAPPLVALLQPEQPTKLLSGVAPAGQGAGASAPQVSVGAIDVEEMGSVYATGRATPGSQCRIYLNGSFVAGVTTGSDGTWSLKIQHGMRPGHYSVRVDELASAAGDVKARAEVPFDYPARAPTAVSLLRPKKGEAAAVTPAVAAVTMAPSSSPAKAAPTANERTVPPAAAVGADSVAAAPSGGQTLPSAGGGVSQVASAADGAAAAPTPGVPTVVAQLLTTRVVHGDSLWRISRKMLGHGRRYTQIYAANTSQIRDPKLIYPGQIFVMPQNAP